VRRLRAIAAVDTLQAFMAEFRKQETAKTATN